MSNRNNNYQDNGRNNGRNHDRRNQSSSGNERRYGGDGQENHHGGSGSHSRQQDRNRGNMYASNPLGRNNGRVLTNGKRPDAPTVQPFQDKKAPIEKRDLPYNDQKFANRPHEMVQDKLKLGKKIDVYTNHARVILPEETIVLNLYDIEIWLNQKKLIKREEAAPWFWKIVRANSSKFPNVSQMIFNDVNQLWTLKNFPLKGATGTLTLREGQGWRAPQAALHWKYVGPAYIGMDVKEEQSEQVMSTIIDAIATARIRRNESHYTVFKKLTILLQDDAKEAELEGVDLWKHFQWGTDARVGVSMAVRLNLRAGVTACFDVSHTLFTRPGYPLVRLFVELIDNQVIEDEEFEENYDQFIRNAHPTDETKKTMASILRNMSLLYSLTGFFATPEALRNEAVRSIQPKAFKFFDLGGSPVEERFNKVYPNGESRIITVAEHYLEQYGIRLLYPNLPCLMKKPPKNRPDRVVLFPMETVSYLSEAVRYDGNACDELKAEMIRATAYTPEQRQMLLQHIISQKGLAGAPPMIDNDDAYMKGGNLTINKDMITAKATILPAPTLKYGNSTFFDADNLGEWDAVRCDEVRTVVEESLYVPNSTKKKRIVGSILVIESASSQGGRKIEPNTMSYNCILSTIEECGVPIVKMPDTNLPETLDCQYYRQGKDQPGDLEKYFVRLRDYVDTNYNQGNEEFHTIPVVFLLFTVRCSLYKQSLSEAQRSGHYNEYNMMKHLCDNRQGLITQGMLINNFNSILPDRKTCKLTCHIVEKIIGKIGVNHRIIERNDKHKPWKLLAHPDAPTLVLGIDVSHPAAEDRYRVKPGYPAPEMTVRNLSVAAVVGNIDTSVTQFRSSSRLQMCGEEQIVWMKDQVRARIVEFMDRTNKRPAHIVVYRDGVSEGDFQKVLYEEKKMIQEVCSDLSIDSAPTLTYIVVSKRHHTKFFPMNKEDGDSRYEFNVKPGTLVENEVTSTKYFDFFLASQPGIMGTSRPTHYYVLHDTWAPMISFWQTVTHVLTYNFCRTTSSVSLPAPVIYAHLAAKRAKEALDARNDIDKFEGINLSAENLSNQLRLTDAVQFHDKLDGMPFV